MIRATFRRLFCLLESTKRITWSSSRRCRHKFQTMFSRSSQFFSPEIAQTLKARLRSSSMDLSASIMTRTKNVHSWRRSRTHFLCWKLGFVTIIDRQRQDRHSLLLSLTLSNSTRLASKISSASCAHTQIACRSCLSSELRQLSRPYTTCCQLTSQTNWTRMCFNQSRRRSCWTRS